ncbi:hypothetical protein VNO78_24440 [Psophocarpus tetragonolobus]|uniref:Uncharacterized protein n=1 Tax=Psophocarpus tetragonolobus TaxID=3891 RepID=A0AAN9XER5_PSOTE
MEIIHPQHQETSNGVRGMQEEEEEIIRRPKSNDEVKVQKQISQYEDKEDNEECKVMEMQLEVKEGDWLFNRWGGKASQKSGSLTFRQEIDLSGLDSFVYHSICRDQNVSRG